MDVNDVKILIDFIIAKNNGNGYNSPDEFNNYIQFAESGYFDYLRGEYQRYQVQRAVAPVSFGQNQDIRTSLTPLIYGAVLSINPSTGIAPFPSDFQLVDSMFTLYGLYNIKFVQQDRLSAYTRSTIDPVSRNPIFLIQNEGFHFYPESLGNARMSYLRTPPYMRWGYVENSNGELIYDPSKSTQPCWSEMDLMQVIVRALALSGVNLQARDVIQYANDIKNGGQ